MPILQTKSLGFSYHTQPLFKNLNLSIQSGQCLWIEGPNGVGKTTLLKCLVGLTTATRGDIFWDQETTQNNPKFNQACHWIGHKTPLKDALTGHENLTLLNATHSYLPPDLQPYASLSNQHALTQLGLTNAQHLPIKSYSAGMKRRLLLAKLLCRPAPLWILDEPMNALDSEGTVRFQSLANQHLQQGGLIILSSHLPLPQLETQRLIRLNLAKPSAGKT